MVEDVSQFRDQIKSDTIIMPPQFSLDFVRLFTEERKTDPKLAPVFSPPRLWIEGGGVVSS